jgi:hypothetical protein
MIKIIGSVLVIFLILIIILHIIMSAKHYQHHHEEDYHRPPSPSTIGGCSGTRYGCCNNNITPKKDEMGSNCIHPDIHLL